MIDPCFPSLGRRFGTQTALVALASVSALALAASVLVACGSSDRTAAAAKVPGLVRVETLEHEPCSEVGKRVELLDTNNDGRADIRRVFDPGTGHETCRSVDLNHDGKADFYEYFTSDGTIRRREFCYDDGAAVNALELYEGGQLARREYDTTGHHKIDTWDWFDRTAPVDAKTGRPAHPTRRERDTSGDGAIDQWWTWEGDRVTISTDRNGDGKPDTNSTVVLGGDDAGAVTSAASPDAGASAASASSSPSAGDGAPPSAAEGEGGKS